MAYALGLGIMLYMMGALQPSSAGVTATCSLVLRGFGPSQIGVSYASLNCTSAAPVKTAVSSAYISRFVKGFSGVQVVLDDSVNVPCKAQISTSKDDLADQSAALLYFCYGKYSISFVNFDIQAITLKISDSYWAPVMFGQQVQAVIEGGHVSDNRASSMLMAVQSARLIMVDSEFNSNTGVMGACIYAQEHTKLHIKFTLFINSNAVINAAGIGIEGPVQALLDHCAFKGGRCNAGGGCVGITGFTGSPHVSINFTLFHNCSSNSIGGGMYINRASHVQLQHVIFRDCEAYSTGGATYIDGQSSLDMHDCAMEHNLASYGGGFAVLEASNVTATNVTLVRNGAPGGPNTLSQMASSGTGGGIMRVVRKLRCICNAQQVCDCKQLCCEWWWR